MGDPVDAAIAQAEVRSKMVQPVIQAQVNLTTGRMAGFAIPSDMTDEEMLDFVKTLTGPVMADIRKIRESGPRPRLFVPS